MRAVEGDAHRVGLGDIRGVVGVHAYQQAADRHVYRIQFLRQVEFGIHAASPRRMRRCAAGVR